MNTPSIACPFCSMPDARVIDRHPLAVVVRDKYPVSPGHTLVIPVRHLGSFFELEQSEQVAMLMLLRRAHQINQGTFPSLPAAGEVSDFYMLPVEEPEAIAQTVVDLVKTRLPGKFDVDPLRDIQVLCPMNRSVTGARAINQALQAALNPPGEHSVEKFGSAFSVGDKVMQIENNYDREVYRDRYLRLTGLSLVDCPACKNGRMVCIETLLPTPPASGPPDGRA